VALLGEIAGLADLARPVPPGAKKRADRGG
jgi:hypothetical protein